MLERFYPNHVLHRLPATEEEFWEAKGLGMNDWSGLAALIFAEIFSLDFLTPLDEMDTGFKLEVFSKCHAYELHKYSIFFLKGSVLESYLRL